MSVAAAACVFFGTGLAPLTVSLLSTAMGGNAIGQALAIVCTVAGILCASLFAFGARFFPRTAVQ
jgi:energy-converting hydrogenase Eha subunit A